MIFNLFSQPLDFAAIIVAIILGLTVHEFSHAWMAARLGDLTAKYAGRLSLNPSRHFDFTGTLFLLLVGFGWGKPVPVNHNALHGRYADLKVSLAGPASNIILAFIIWIPIAIGLGMGYSYEINPVMRFLALIANINVLLVAFNLLPIAPLDGFSIIRALVPRSQHYSLARYEQYGTTILFGILLVEIMTPIHILFPIINTIGYAFQSVITFVLTPLMQLTIYMTSLF